ncbi:MAG: protein TolR [Candidatus Portiera sp.]|nr:protein TolR [Portiera sp.]
MRTVRRKRKLSSDINVVPYIDIMLVLLVVFMVTAPLLSQGYNVDLPAVNAQPIKLKDKSQIVISVDENGEYYYTSGKQSSKVSLKDIEDRIKKLNKEEIEIFIRGDAKVNYGAVISLMGYLQKAGIDNMGLVTQPAKDS